jgi:hypothetical protein
VAYGIDTARNSFGGFNTVTKSDLLIWMVLGLWVVKNVVLWLFSFRHGFLYVYGLVYGHQHLQQDRERLMVNNIRNMGVIFLGLVGFQSNILLVGKTMWNIWFYTPPELLRLQTHAAIWVGFTDSWPYKLFITMLFLLTLVEERRTIIMRYIHSTKVDAFAYACVNLPMNWIRMCHLLLANNVVVFLCETVCVSVVSGRSSPIVATFWRGLVWFLTPTNVEDDVVEQVVSEMQESHAVMFIILSFVLLFIDIWIGSKCGRYRNSTPAASHQFINYFINYFGTISQRTMPAGRHTATEKSVMHAAMMFDLRNR